MCDPVVGTALAIGSALTQFQAQRQQAKAQEDYNRRQYDAAVLNRNENLAYNNAQAEQERQNANQRLDQIEQQRQAQTATARVASGEAGVSGLSVEALLSDISGSAGDASTATITNYLRGQQGLDLQRTNINNAARSTVNNLQAVNRPDFLGTALKIGVAADSYMNPKVK